ncbi:MAG: hypothetical protein Q8R40_06895 [bacterium]|nr:hypothetical protein [bacterium]
MPNPPTQYHYTLSPEQQQRFADIYLLRRMINEPLSFKAELPGDDSLLEPILTRLFSKGWVTIDPQKALYVPTQAGREPLKKFEQRYYDYLKIYDAPYPATSLVYGDFGHTHLSSFSSKESFFELLREERWRPYINTFHEYMFTNDWAQIWSGAFTTFLNLEEWEDLRVAVAEYKGLEPLEITFMSLLNEGCFDQPERNWKFDLHAGWFFNEVERIANKAMHMDQVIADGWTSAQLMQNIIIAGTELMMTLIAQQEEQERQYAEQQQQYEAEQTHLAQQARANAPQTETITTAHVVEEVSYVTVVEPVYYPYSYYSVYAANPFYVAPIWYDPWYW